MMPDRLSFARWAAFVGLWTLAVTRPAFDAVSSGPEALTQNGAGWLDVLLFAVILGLVLPTVVVAAASAIKPGSAKLNENLFVGLLGLMFGMIVWHNLSGLGFEVGRYIFSAWAAFMFAWLFLRFELIRNFALFTVVALPVVMVLFAFSYPVSNELGGGADGGDFGEASGDAPIILVVFDEFSSPFLENGDGSIDADLYPNFAALARESTWYRNAIGAADSTVRALPAIFTGSVPPDKDQPTPPGSTDFPDNLCQILREGGYEIDASEQITNFCSPRAFSPKATIQLLGLGGTNVPPVPERFSTGLRNWLFFNYSRDGFPRLDDFINSLEADPKSFDFVHVTVPHQPWVFLPNGQEYPTPEVEGFDSDNKWSEHREEVDASLQRYALQAALVDRKVGDLVRRLKSMGRWEESMVIFTADHGIFFGPNGPRREATRETAGQALAVPLFVKYPGQIKVRRVDRPVSNASIAPTILQAAGVKPLPSSQAETLDESARSSGTSNLAATSLRELGVGWNELDRQLSDARQMNERLFGDGSFYAIGGHFDLLGQPVASIPDLQPLELSLEDAGKFDDVDPGGESVPALIDGRVSGPVNSGAPVAVAINGTIRATGEVWNEGDGSTSQKITLVVPPTSFKTGKNDVSVYAIPDQDGE